jgi:hypothetical protein
MRSRIMHIECKAGGLTGTARIGRVNFSKTGRTLYYGNKKFQSLKGHGGQANYYHLVTGDHYWISGCRKDGADRLYGERVPVFIDADVREEYWTKIRELPDKANEQFA